MDLNPIVHMGKTDRDVISYSEFHFPDGSGVKFDILVASHGLLRDTLAIWAEFHDNGLTIDEVHRGKSAHCYLQEMCSEFRIF
jgi:hypothetical protein